MADKTERFFEELAERKFEPLLERADGSVRFELDDGGGKLAWVVGIQRGTITVNRANGKPIAADSVCYTDKAVFERIVAGELNPMAAALRGLLRIEGDAHLFVLVQRLVRAGGARAGGQQAEMQRAGTQRAGTQRADKQGSRDE